MNFSTFTPHQLRKAIEIELQKTDDVKIASITALKRLNEDPGYYEDMTKARTHKYYKRIPKPSGKGYIYFYTKSDYESYSKSKETASTQKEGWIRKIAELFRLKEVNDVFIRIKNDYERNKIKETYGVDLTGWKDHLNEYFAHKDRWDKFFTKVKPVVKGKDKTPTGKPGEKKASGKKESRIKLSVMKTIFGLYGPVPPGKEEPAPDNFETMPETKKKETIDTGNGSKIETNVKLTPEEKKEEVQDEAIANREGYFNEKPADILNVGKDVWGAARHNYTTYEKFDADISQMEADGTASAYVTRKNLIGSYGLLNKDERVSNGETEYKVLASFLIRDLLSKVPDDSPESRSKYIGFSRAIVRLDNETTTAKDYLMGLSELFEITFPQVKLDQGRFLYGADFALGEDLDTNGFTAKGTIGPALRAFFNFLNNPGYKRDYYGLDKKEKKGFENLSNVLLSEGTGKKSYEEIKVDILGETKAVGIKIKKGDTVILSDNIKNHVYLNRSKVLDEAGYNAWKEEKLKELQRTDVLPQNGDTFKIKQTLRDSKGNLEEFEDDVTILKIDPEWDMITYSVNGSTERGSISSKGFMREILSGRVTIKNIQDPNTFSNINDSLEKLKKLNDSEKNYILRDRIYPESEGQVAKAGKDTIIVSFPFPDGKIRSFRIKPSEIKSEDIQTIKKNINKKSTLKLNLFIESKVIRTGGTDLSNTKTSDIQKILQEDMQIKSLQYGNSMPDDERAAHTRWAAESFMDLSDILNIPLKQVTVNGKLGMAFGARGKMGALAHYEPDTKMINITRGKGFGSFAHEWGHFLDNILSKDMQSFITVTPEFKTKVVTTKEEIKHGSIYEAKGKRYFFDTNAKNPKYPFALLAKGQTEPDSKSSYAGFYNYRMTVSEPVDNELSRKANGIAKKSIEALHKNAEELGGINEKMIKEDKYLNKKEEAFARAFECYIADSLENNGRKNTYLASKAKTIESDGSFVYPQGEIREEINSMFDDFFNSLRGSEDLKKAIKAFFKRLNPVTAEFEYRRA